MPGFRNESVGEIKVDSKGSTVSTNNINFSALENLNVMNEHISPSEAETLDFSAIMPNDVETPVAIPDPPTDVRQKMDEDAGKALEELNRRRNGENPVPVPDPIGEDRRRMDEEARRALEDLKNARNGGSFEGGNGGSGGGLGSW